MCQAPLSMDSSVKNWSGFPFPSPGDFPNPGIKPPSPALKADSSPSEPVMSNHLSICKGFHLVI